MHNKVLIFKHSSFSSDLIYSMAGIKSICESDGYEGIVHQWLGQSGRQYINGDHPYKGEAMNEYAFNMMKPLIEAQSYIQSFDIWSGQPVMIDFDMLKQVKTHMPYGNAITWMGMIKCEMMPEYWKPWLRVQDYNEDLEGKILINRTTRYHGQWIDYFHLKKYADNVVFTGLPEEHEKFCHDWDIQVPLLEVANFYDLAVAINSCKLFIGNQSMCFAIAEGLKAPRLLEVCDFIPNVHPTGDGAHYFRAPEALEYLLDKLMKE